ncbi:MAG TPA: BTAD domain-containing putative transcriptional regulator [Acidimicrobiales bacterium]|nr:BTAD domain-containing putative transcriptional regulator [Acidimicrobiales bacterium]
MEFRVLGPVEVGDGGQAMAPTRAKERCLLGVLLAHANHVVSADRVAEALWPGTGGPENAVRSVQTHVSRLRSALGPASERLLARPPGYLLRVEPGELDAQRFELLLDEARRRAGEEPDEALGLLEQALGLWRGPPYGEFRYDEFAVGEAVRLEELRLVAIEERIDARLALGRHEEEVGELEALCAEHPLRERLRSQLMVALYRSGRQPDALRAFESYRRLLAEELGLDPSPELRALERRILDHDPRLAPRRTAAGTPALVATPFTSFVGREAAVAEVIRHVADARLLTLIGPGGVGKTRLAVQVAAAVAGRFPDGVVLCELAAVADPDAVAPAIATALGIQPRPDRSVEASIADVLRTRRMLLVVDNCEHVVDAAASLLSTLIGSCPLVTVLATSRERLAIAGEQVWPLAPLPPEAAVELFCDRALAVRPDLDCEGQARADIVAICRRLDGLPLAIELAAAQMAAMNPADLVHRLDDRFRLLDRGSRSGPSRHRSLVAVVDWSYERLGRPQRRLFDRLSVFAGTFTLEAAEDVCAGDGVARGEIPELVAELVEVSLAALTGDTEVARYRLLETLRAYGRARLEGEGAARRWEERHADYHVELARRADVGLNGPEEGRWMRRLDAELDELRAAHRWALAHDDAERALALSAALHGYAYRSLRPELFAWAERAARLPGAVGHRLLPLVLGSAATGAWGRGDLAGARRLAEEAVRAAAGAPEGHLGSGGLAVTALFGGDLAEARAQGLRAAELADACGDPYQALVNRVTATLALAYGGHTQDAIDEAEAALAAARELGCPSARAWALYQLGEVLLDQDPPRALRLLDESHGLAAGVGSTFLTGVAGTSATSLRARHGDPEEALRRFPDLIDLWERAGNWTQQWTMLRSLVTTLARLGRDEPAAVLYGALTASHTAPPLFGADRERLAEVVTTIEERTGRQQLAAWVEQGCRLGDGEVVAFARAAARSTQLLRS